MTQQEFENTVRKGYYFDTSLSYIWATVSLFLGLFILYELLFTSWSNQITSVLNIVTLIFACWAVYFGIRGFLLTKYLFKVQKINISKSKNNLTLIFNKIAEANGFKKQIEYPNAAIYNTKSFFKHQKELYVFFDENFILLNIQQRQYRGIKFLNFSGSMGILKKIVTQLRQQLI